MTVRAPTLAPDATHAPTAMSVSSPTKHRAPTVAPTETCAKSPTTVSWSTEPFVFTMTPRPMLARGRTIAPAEIIEPSPIVALLEITVKG